MRLSIPSAVAASVLMLFSMGYVFADNGGQGQNRGNNNNHNNTTQIRLRTNLAGAALGGMTPEGRAEFRMQNNRSRFDVEVENVNLPAGTVLTVAIVHAGMSTTVGTITVGGGGNQAENDSGNEIELDSQNGDMVPAVASGDMVTVSNGAAVILAGAF